MKYDFFELSVPITITGKEIKAFFSGKKDCLRKINVIFHSKIIYNLFEKEVYNKIKERIDGTELKEVDIFKSKKNIEEFVLAFIESIVVVKALGNFLYRQIDMNNENILKNINEGLILEGIKNARDALVVYIENYEANLEYSEEPIVLN